MKHGGILGVLIILLSASVVLSVGCTALRWGSEAKEVAYQELRPAVLLKKYRYFKSVAAQLDQMQANISLATTAQAVWEKRYQGVPVEQWPRHVSEQYDQRLTETNALKAAYNSLAADYNKAMVDLGYSFCNVGEMPKGFPPDATALKRSYAEYRLN